MKNVKHVKLEQLCKMQSGGTPSRKNIDYWDNGDILWAKISDLENSPDGYIYDTEEKITSIGLNSINNRFFPINTLFLAMYGSVGKVAISKKEMSTNQAILGINIIDEKVLDIKYLKFWFYNTKTELLDKAVGVALKNISLGLVKNLEIPLPPLATQKAIAEKLDKADALRKKDQELLKQYDELAQSIFIDMFGDPVQNEKGWELKELGEYLDVLTDYHANGSYEILKENVTLLDEPNFALMVRTTDLENKNFYDNVKYIDEKAYLFLEKSKVYENDIIINKIGSAGNVYLMPKLEIPVSLGMNAFLLRFNGNYLTQIFVYFLLSSSYGKREMDKRIKGAVTKTIRKDALKEIPIFVPPIELQNQFAEKIKNIEAQKELVKKQAEASENLFQALLQESFSFT